MAKQLCYFFACSVVHCCRLPLGSSWSLARHRPRTGSLSTSPQPRRLRNFDFVCLTDQNCRFALLSGSQAPAWGGVVRPARITHIATLPTPPHPTLAPCGSLLGGHCTSVVECIPPPLAKGVRLPREELGAHQNWQTGPPAVGTKVGPTTVARSEILLDASRHDPDHRLEVG
mmetsp:Transcript_25736/g.46487  ORF Transcript_25736/g.46487 Transcript_25736/m.46487 type:complete len:172 (-) Transcript_25736:185-700(-)